MILIVIIILNLIVMSIIIINIITITWMLAVSFWSSIFHKLKLNINYNINILISWYIIWHYIYDYDYTHSHKVKTKDVKVAYHFNNQYCWLKKISILILLIDIKNFVKYQIIVIMVIIFKLNSQKPSPIYQKCAILSLMFLIIQFYNTRYLFFNLSLQ